MNRFLVALAVFFVGYPTLASDFPRYIALGDSYTSGESVSPAQTWPAQLSAALNIPAPTVIARTGWTTDELSAAIDRKNPQGPFELVTLLIGVNNQYRGRSADEYRGEFAVLLDRAIKLAGGSAKRVVVLSIPDWGSTPFASGQDRAKIGSEIDAFNTISRQATEKAGAFYVDINPQSKSAGTDPSMVASDGLHPSGKMYAEWARLALPSARSAIKGKN